MIISFAGFFVPAGASGLLAGKTIILDAGHGTASSPGWSTYNEAVAMLDLANRIKPLLEEHGARVLLTRKDAINVPIAARCAMMNIWALEEVRKTRTVAEELVEIDELIKLMNDIIRTPAIASRKEGSLGLMNTDPYSNSAEIHDDLRRIFELTGDKVIGDNFLMISLHSNATASPVNPSVRGGEVYFTSPALRQSTQTYYPDYPYSSLSREFADSLLNHIAATGIPRRSNGLRAEDYMIIREINMPAVLAENGFHTNPDDRLLLMSPEYMNSLAITYTNAVVKYFTGTVLNPPPVVIPRTPPYNDISVNNPSYDAIRWAKDNSIFAGINGDFVPAGTLTRGCFALILWRLEGCPIWEWRGAGFPDIDPSIVHYNALRWTQDVGIIGGINGRAYPTATLPRYQLITMMYRYHNYKKLPAIIEPGVLDKFPDRTDLPSTNDYNAMEWAVTNSIIGGINNRLVTHGITNREMGATVLYRYNNQFNTIGTRSMSAPASSSSLFDVVDTYTGIDYVVFDDYNE